MRRVKPFWEVEEIRVLREAYQSGKLWDEIICLIPTRTELAIRKKGKGLKLRRPSNYVKVGPRTWKADEVKILVEHYQSSSQKEILNLLPRKTLRAIRGKAHRLSLKRDLSNACKGHPPWNKGKKGVQVAWNKGLSSNLQPAFGYRHTDQARIAISLANKGKLVSLETRRKYSEWQRGRQLSAEHIANVAKAIRENPPWLGKHFSEEHRKHISEGRIKALKANPEIVRKCLSSRRPTDIEQRAIDIIEKYSLPYKYTGNGTFQIGGKYPDFVNTNGKKIALDVFGDRWHNPSEIPERTAIFAEYGWTLIIIWGHELWSLPELEIVRRLNNGRAKKIY